MLILSRVCAEFHDKEGVKIFAVTPSTRLSFQEAPESIKQDPLFRMLVNDGSLEVSTGPVRKKMLENDPEQKAPGAPESDRKRSAVPAGEKGPDRKNAEKKE